MRTSRAGVLTAWKAVSWTITALAAVLLAVALAWVAMPSVLHAKAFVVLTGSMQPALPTGSVALVREADPAQIAVGDILTFYHPESTTRALVTHRVVEVGADAHGRTFRTRGDANDLDDDWVVPEANAVGTVFKVVPYAGHATSALQSRFGLLLLIGIPGSVIVAGELGNIWREVSAGRRKQVT